MKISEIMFGVNLYDKDGDIAEECVLLHIGNTILKFDDVAELKRFSGHIISMIPEIMENLGKGEK